MATKLLLKKSSTAGAVPLTTDLEIGEVAVNLNDRKLYTKNNSNEIIRIDAAFLGAIAPSSPAKGDIWYDSTANALKAYNGASWDNATINTIVDSSSFSTATGELTIHSNNGSSVVVGLDGRYAPTAHGHVAADISNFTESAQDATGALLTGATMNGISVTYDDATNKLNFDVNDPTITLTGAVTGAATMTNLGSVSIATTLAAHTHTLDSGSNVTITSNTNGEILRWNGTAWINNTLAEAGAAAASHTHTSANVTDFTEAVQDVVGGAYLTAAGILSKNYNDTSNTLTLTATEADTLASVTSRGATTASSVTVGNLTAGSGTFSGSVTVSGDLTVNGTTNLVNSNVVNIGDSIIVLNADEAGTPSQDAGIDIERGTLANVSLLWKEATDYWSFGGQIVGDLTLDGGAY